MSDLLSILLAAFAGSVTGVVIGVVAFLWISEREGW